MINAHEPPELPPIVARPAGSLVSFTLPFFSTRGSTSFSTNSAYRPDIVSYSKPRSLPWASPLPLPMEIAIITGTRCAAIRLSRAANKVGSGSICTDDEGCLRAGDVLFGNVHRYPSRIRCRIAVYDHLVRVRRVRDGERVGLARDAGIDLAVLGFHREFKDVTLGRSFVRGHFRRGIVGGANDEVPVFLRRGDGAVR